MSNLKKLPTFIEGICECVVCVCVVFVTCVFLSQSRLFLTMYQSSTYFFNCPNQYVRKEIKIKIDLNNK